MKKENKKKNRKIFLSLIVILFVGIVLTASTYTWFTANQTVRVEQLDVNVTASNGLQVSVDAQDWKTLITKDDILGASNTYTAAVNQIPAGDTAPVSTAGEIDTGTGFINMYRGELTDEGDLGRLTLSADQVTETNGTDGDFIAFDLFFQTNQVMPIQLTSASSVVASGLDTNIQNAARVAFLPQGNVAAGADPEEAQALKAVSNTDLKIWEPNYDAHTDSAIQHAEDNYGMVEADDITGRQVKYFGLKAEIAPGSNIEQDSEDPTYFTDMSASGKLIYSPASGIPTTQFLNVFTLQPGITKVRIYMWVEGQDIDCENNASGGGLGFNLQFSALTESA